MSSSLVTFIVPIYNKEQHLRECIDSIAAQTLPDIEILCVDNNSSDGSVAIVEEMMSADPRIRLLHETEQGLPQARNCGMAAATGEYIAFVDADDFVDPRLAELTVDSARCCGSDVVLFPFADNRLDPDKFKKVWARKLPRPGVRALDLGADLSLYFTPSVWSKLFKRDFLESNNLLFDPELKQAEDVLFSYSAIVSAACLSQVCDPPLYFYRRRVAGSMISDRSSVEQSFMALKAYDKLDHWLQVNGKKDDFEAAFLRKLLSEIEYTFDLTDDFEAFRCYFDEYRHRYADAFSSEAAKTLQSLPMYRTYIASRDFDEAMFLRSKRAKRSFDEERHRSDEAIRKAKKKRDRLKMEKERIQGSRVYKYARRAEVLSKAFPFSKKGTGKK